MEEKGKKLGLWNIVGLGLGGAIGTGIFVLMGYGIAYTGRSISLVVAIGCFFMLLAYWYNLAMPSMFVMKGGDYSMKAMLFNPFMCGISAWMTLVNGLAMSSYAVAMAQYLAIAIPALKNYQTIVAFVAITLFFLSTIKGSRFVTILENIVTIVLVAALALFVVFGIGKVDFGATFASTDGGFFHGGFAGFVSALAVMGWACQGTTMAPVSMAAVTKNPKRTIPVGIIIITCMLAVVYGAMGIVAGGVLPYDQIAGQNISVTAEAIFPNALYVFFVVGGGLTGCEIALDLHRQGKQPVIVELKNDLIAVKGVCLANSSYLRDFFALNNVEVHLDTMLSEVTDKGVIVKAKDGSTFEIEGDTVLISAGYIPTPAFPQDKHVHLVGDCNGVGNLRTVIWRAWDVAMAL